MIGYFVFAGDPGVSHQFSPYNKVFSKIIKKQVGNKYYGDGLTLILISYYLEGEFLELPYDQIHVRRYSKKEQAITVIVGVSKDFYEMTDFGKKRFLANATLESVDLVEKKYKKKNYFNINFQELKSDINSSISEFQNCEITL